MELPHEMQVTHKSLRPFSQSSDGIVWYDASAMGVEGRGWCNAAAPFDRLPSHAQGLVPDAVWLTSRCPSGLSVRFVTDATHVSACWRVLDLQQPTHMSPTGMRGVDLYARCPNGWRWVATGLAGTRHENRRLLVKLEAPTEHEYLLYFPLFTPVEFLHIGTNPSARVRPAPAYPREGAVCIYGTSLTQGACASRAGMAYPAIVGRRLDRPVVNLGFSGSGRMESVMAELLGEVGCAAYVLDCIPNMSLDQVQKRVKPFVLTLRSLRPSTPIVLVDNPAYQDAWFSHDARRKCRDRTEALLAVYRELTAEKVPWLTLVPGDTLHGTDGDASVANHATDLGMSRYADGVYAGVARALEDGGEARGL